MFSLRQGRPLYPGRGRTVSALTIRRSSWHYRLWKWHHGNTPENEPRDLCSYFWGLVNIILSLVFIPLAVVVFAAWIVLLALESPWLLLWIPAVFTMVAGGVVLLALLLLAYDRWGPKPSPELRSSFGVARAYLAAKKQRICPLVEVEQAATNDGE